MKNLMLSLALVIGFSSVGHAGMLLEPYVGYVKAKTSASLAGTADDREATGPGYGLRLGYTFPVMFWLALDASQNTGTYSGSSAGDFEGKRTAYGIDFGFDFPILVRGWVGYNFNEELAAESSGSTNTLKGTGTKIGVGTTLLPFVSINLEYIMAKYTEGSGPGFSIIPFGTAYSKYENNIYVLSVSLPLDL
ncbi:MAG: outer membrane beta-barrel protein [Bdellovibrionota bacterium]